MNALPETIEAFLARLADGAPTPGGGAAAALVAAVAAALVGMVCRVTARRSPSSRVEDIARAADRCRERATALIEEDARAYGGVVEARRAPRAAKTCALLAATRVPLDVARVADEVLKLAEDVAPSAATSAMSDLLVSATLAHAAVESAATTAKTNLKTMEKSDATLLMEEEITQRSSDATACRHRIRELAEGRR